MRVPPAFAITTDAYRTWRHGGDLAEIHREVAGAYRRLRDGGAELVAARSSATVEDHPDASFAGLFATVLGVPDEAALFTAIEQCWRSADTSMADGYLRNRLREGDVAMAVVVQALVPSESAGVMFTVHPVTQNLGHAVITGAFGLGEVVVSGRVSPDTWVVERGSGRVVSEHLGTKVCELVLRPGGVEEAAIGAPRSTSPSLTSAQLAELVTVGERLERHVGFPQDVEWAFANGSLYVLQSRNITTVRESFLDAALYEWLTPAERASLDEQIWERGSPMSALPVSPLFFTDMARFFVRHFDNMAGVRGWLRPPVSPLRYHHAWSYVNPVTRSWLASHTPPRWRDPATWPYIRLQLRRPISLGIPTAARRYYRVRDRRWIPRLVAARPDLGQAQPAELLRYIGLIDETRFRGCLVAGNGIDHCKVWLGTVTWMLRRWAGLDDPSDVLASLTSGLPGGETHAETVAVWRLAGLVRTPAERDVVATGDPTPLRTAATPSPFMIEFDRLKRTLAHRGSSDRDFRHPRFGDSNELLLAQVRAFLRSDGGNDPVRAHHRSETHRRTVTDGVIRQVARRGPAGPIRALALRLAVRELQVGWIFRDNQRHLFDHFLWNLRQTYLELGRRLVAAGVLAEPDAVFWCTRDELFAAFQGRLALAELGRRVAYRRPGWDEDVANPPALRLGGDTILGGDVCADAEPGGSTLRGTGGSRGVTTGPVRVVQSVTRVHEIERGDILVTHSIDPAWSAVFALLAGIVTEESGLLSHVTVLSREYGVPAVIGLAGATSVLRTGEWVTIDGVSGLVTRADPVPEPQAAAEP